MASESYGRCTGTIAAMPTEVATSNAREKRRHCSGTVAQYLPALPQPPYLKGISGGQECEWETPWLAGDRFEVYLTQWMPVRERHESAVDHHAHQMNVAGG
jgi:hypothetical protein